uniref:Uncharacterized protein n=1 Tax=Haptolina brevifila TaxID=156173 RepID=A0A7S2JRN4_9EUKA
MAASIGHVDLCFLLFRAKGPALLEAQNLMGSRPLHFAAKAGKRTVATLLQLGADATARDRSGATPEDEARAAAKQLPERDAGHQHAIKILRLAPSVEERQQMMEEQRLKDEEKRRKAKQAEPTKAGGEQAVKRKRKRGRQKQVKGAEKQEL